jgi:dihydropyrimidinase
MDGRTRILIRGGKVVNEDLSFMSDVYIENGKIADIGRNLKVPAGAQIIDATNMLVMPGGIDTHTHMELAFMGTKAVDDFYIGTKVSLTENV